MEKTNYYKLLYKNPIILPNQRSEFEYYLAQKVNEFSRDIPSETYDYETVKKIVDLKLLHDRHLKDPQKFIYLINIISLFIKDPNEETFRETVERILQYKTRKNTIDKIFPFRNFKFTKNVI